MKRLLLIATLFVSFAGAMICSAQEPAQESAQESAKESAQESAKESAQESRQVKLSDKLLPLTEDNVFWDKDYYNWCNSIIKGEDGLYHLIYSRWKRSLGFGAWMTHSEIAHAVSERPEGPYTYRNTVLAYDQDHYKAGDPITAHNPKIKYFNGKYYLYFISSYMDRDISQKELEDVARQSLKAPLRKELRENQRTYVAVSSSLDGKWKRRRQSLLEPCGPITRIVVNPAVTQGPDGRFYMIVKGDRPGTEQFLRNQAAASSDHPDRGFVMYPQPVIDDIDTEDVSIWYSERTSRFYAVFHAHKYIGMITSTNGVDWQRAEDFTVTDKKLEFTSGTVIPVDRMERPFIFTENGRERVLGLAVKKGDDSCIVFVPLRAE